MILYCETESEKIYLERLQKGIKEILNGTGHGEIIINVADKKIIKITGGQAHRIILAEHKKP